MATSTPRATLRKAVCDLVDLPANRRTVVVHVERRHEDPHQPALARKLRIVEEHQVVEEDRLTLLHRDDGLALPHAPHIDDESVGWREDGRIVRDHLALRVSEEEQEPPEDERPQEPTGDGEERDHSPAIARIQRSSAGASVSWRPCIGFL